MDPWSIGMALASVGGQLFTNRSNRRMADRSMAFSERMSSTAAQRAVEDYRRAGLNPALAYDRPASSPGGTMAQMGDVVGAGVSSAMDAKRLRSELESQAEQRQLMKAQRIAAGAQAQAASSQSDLNWANASLANYQLETNKLVQPFQISHARANAALQAAMVPGAQAEADMWKSLQNAGPVVKALAPIIRLMRPALPR